MNKLSLKNLPSAVAALGLALSLCPSAAVAQDVSAQVSDQALESDRPNYPPYSAPFHKSFREWSAEWWQYALSIPVSVNPLSDTTGDYCAVGQHGSVWFLVGSMDSSPVNRTCVLPEGKALFFPVINRFDTDPLTIKQLRALVAPCIDAVTSVSAEIDGQEVKGLNYSRIKSVPFDLTLPVNGIYPAGVYSPTVDDGFYVMLKPLSAGEHHLHFAAQQKETAACGPAFSVDVTYTLTAMPVTLGSH